MHLLQPLELLGGLLLDLGRHSGLVDLALDLVHLLRLLVALPQLLMDLPELLPQKVLPLGLAHLVLGLVLDLRLHGGELELAGEQVVDLLQPLDGFVDLKDGLALFDLEAQIGGYQIREHAGIDHVVRDHDDLGREILEVEDLLDLFLDAAHERLDLEGQLDDRLLDDLLYLHLEVGLFPHELFQRSLGQPLYQDLHAAVVELQHAQDGGHRAHAEKVVGFRVILRGIFLYHEKDVPVPRKRCVHRVDRDLPPDEQGNHHVGIDDDVPE